MDKIIRNKPVAQFYYKGTHSHPVKRTVFITEQTKEWFKGYEVREGQETRELSDSPVKTYSVEKVATTSQLRPTNPLYNKTAKSTLQRMSVTELEEIGI